jgi:hypothetical protein
MRKNRFTWKLCLLRRASLMLNIFLSRMTEDRKLVHFLKEKKDQWYAPMFWN